MKSNISLLIPFDLGLELDFVGKDAREIVKEISSRPTANLTFQTHVFPEANLTAQIYKFGVGLIQLSFSAEGDMDFFASFSDQTESILVGKTNIVAWAKTLVDGLISRAKKFASYQYEHRLDEVDIFPIFVFEKGVFPLIALEKGGVAGAGAFIAKYRKALFGIVSGEPNYDALSAFVLDQEKLVNFGYYENEVILIRRFGAVVSSEESHTILDLIRLAYALHWNLRAYNSILDREIDHAQALLVKLPPYYKFWSMPRHYQMFSAEAIGFVQDKLAIVDSLHNVSANIPRIDSDWHLRTVYKNVEKEFDIDDLSKAVETKLDRIEQSYNSARDFISTNFFIAVEIVLILSLAWAVFDTILLYMIAQK